jgi:hypothetical protein
MYTINGPLTRRGGHRVLIRRVSPLFLSRVSLFLDSRLCGTAIYTVSARLSVFLLDHTGL